MQPTRGISNGVLGQSSELSRRGFVIGLAALAGCAQVPVAKRTGETGALSDTGTRASTFAMKKVATSATVSHPAQLRNNSGLVTALSARDYQGKAADTNAVVTLATGATDELPAEGYANYTLKVSSAVDVLLYNDGFYVRNNGKLGDKIAYQQGTLGNSAIVIGDKLFISTAGLTSGTPQYVTGGHVLVYNVSDLAKPAAEVKTTKVITTAGTNPTGLGQFIDADGNERLVVMQSGGYSDELASVRVYDPSGTNNEYRLLKTLNLPAGDIGQTDQELQIDSLGYLYVGTANAPLEDGTGNFYKIDLNAGSDAEYIAAKVNLGTNYNNAVVLDEANGRVYVASYNEGFVQILDIETLEVLDQKNFDDTDGNRLLAGPLAMASDPENSGAVGVLALASSGGLFWIGEGAAESNPG